MHTKELILKFLFNFRVVFDRAWTPLDDHQSEIDNIFSSTANGLPLQNELATEIRNEWYAFWLLLSVLF